MIRKGEVTVVQAAKRAGTTMSAIYHLTHRGKLASRREGRRSFVKTASLEAFLAGQLRPSTAFEAARRALYTTIAREIAAGRAAAASACRGVL